MLKSDLKMSRICHILGPTDPNLGPSLTSVFEEFNHWAGMVGLALKWVRLAPNGTNPVCSDKGPLVPKLIFMFSMQKKYGKNDMSYDMVVFKIIEVAFVIRIGLSAGPFDLFSPKNIKFQYRIYIHL